MKKSVGMMLMITALALFGCGATKTSPTVSMYDLRVEMEAADESLPSMLNASSVEEGAEGKFRYISDMDYAKVDSFFVSYSEEGLADEIVVIAVKDTADVQEAYESLKKHKEDRYKLLAQYEPQETKRIEDGLVFSSGQYAVLIICDNSGAVKEKFRQMTSPE